MRRVLKTLGWSAGSLGAMVVALLVTAATPGSAKAALCDWCSWVSPGCAYYCWLNAPVPPNPPSPCATSSGAGAVCVNPGANCPIGFNTGACLPNDLGNMCTCINLNAPPGPNPAPPGPQIEV